MEGKKEKKNKENQPQLIKLGDRIKSLRIKKGYTSHETFANQHDFNRTQYFRYEHGEDLRYSSLLKLVEAFDMTLEEFFSEGFK
jgi:transcriptional regulator with XRE-family HTH domain